MSSQRTTTVVIGAGHSGLAMSRRLSERGIDHVVLERGQVAQSWRTSRWDSLRLLTPNWQSGLPGYDYAGDDPDGYFTMPELIDHLNGYAQAIDAPVRADTTVLRVAHDGEGYLVETTRGDWRADSVVIATGISGVANIPPVADGVPDDIHQITALDYRRPGSLDEGGVLVVGASATGAQLADEIARSGRRVVISTGEMVRMPRSYRGRDIFWWMHHAGVLDERWDEMTDIVRARHLPSPQLIGSVDHHDLNINTLQAHGVEVVGKLGMVRDGIALFSGGLANVVRLADLKQERLLDRFDEWAEENRAADLSAPTRPAEITVPEQPRLSLDLRKEGITTVLWATGFKPVYPWLQVPVLDAKGAIVHDGGVTEAPGLYTLGTSVLRRRRSTYLNGAAADTLDIAEHLVGSLAAV